MTLLDFGALGVVVAAWRELMNVAGDDWLAAEHAMNDAIVASGRVAEHDALIEQLGSSFRRPTGIAPAAAVGPAAARAASAEYVTSVALGAVLVRDRLSREQFASLYAAVAAVIPVESLVRE